MDEEPAPRRRRIRLPIQIHGRDNNNRPIRVHFAPQRVRLVHHHAAAPETTPQGLDPAYLIPISQLQDSLAENQPIIVDDTLDERLHCTICYDILKNPVGCGNCVNRFCSDCLSHWFWHNNRGCPVCRSAVAAPTPDRDLERELAAIIRPCQHCHAEIGLHQIKEHMQACEYTNVRCRFSLYGCEWVGKRSEGHDCALARSPELLELYRRLKIDHEQMKAHYSNRLLQLEIQNMNARLLAHTEYSARNPLHIMIFAVSVFCDPRSLDLPEWDRFRRRRRADIINFMALLPTFVLGMKFLYEPNPASDAATTTDIVLGTLFDKQISISTKSIVAVTGCALFMSFELDIPGRLLQRMSAPPMRLSRTVLEYAECFCNCATGLLFLTLYDVFFSWYKLSRSRQLWWSVAFASWFPASVLRGMMAPPASHHDVRSRFLVYGLGLGWAVQFYNEMECVRAMLLVTTIEYPIRWILSKIRERQENPGPNFVRFHWSMAWLLYIVSFGEYTVKFPHYNAIAKYGVVLVLAVQLERFLIAGEVPDFGPAVFMIQAGAGSHVAYTFGQIFGRFLANKARQGRFQEFALLLSFCVLIAWVLSLVEIIRV